MSGLWKSLRTNWMYWRFRNITRNRLRLQAWWNHRRSGIKPRRPSLSRGFSSSGSYRPRASSSFVYRGSPRKAWGYLLGMVFALTALSVWATSTYINPSLVYGLGALVIVGTVYLAMRSA